MERTKTTDRIRPLWYRGVTLEESHYKAQREETIELYLSLKNEDILHNAMRRAGLEDTSDGLPGWGGNLGQFMGAFAKLYCVTGDTRLKEKALSLANTWADLAQEHPQLLHGGTYGYDKMIGGLLDLYEYLGYERAKELVSKLTDVSIKDLDRTIDRDGLQDERMHGQIEWYTLPENIYRAYQLFGDEKYKEHAQAWHYDYMWNKILNHDFKIGPRHAYSHVNCLSSAARAYEVTGEQKYLDIMEIAYEEITTHHCYATGGFGPGENLFIDRDDYLGFMLESPWDLRGDDPTFINFAGNRVARSDAWGSCEVSCCAWAVFKFCNYLLRHTGKAKYAMWAEQFLYNCTGGQPPIKKNGDLLYYAQYFADGGMKTTVDRRIQQMGQNFAWQCCSGTFPQDVAEYANMIYYYDENAIYVAQYLPSTLKLDFKGQKVSLQNFSDFPKHSRAAFELKLERSDSFALKFRVPQWATGKNAVTINGKVTDTKIEPDEWLVLEREWNDGDLIAIDYEFKLYFKPVDQYRPNLMALCYGPIVLVSTEMTVLEGNAENPASWIVPVRGKEMTFRTLPGHTGAIKHICRTFVPYWSYPEDKWYFMYHRVFAEGEMKPYRKY